jgi:hypothetical protein
MLSDLAGHLALPVLVVLLLGGLAALFLSWPSARGKLDRSGWLAPALAALVAAALGWLYLYAIGEDSYYRLRDVSRWDHATRDAGHGVVIVLFAIPIIGLGALLFAACSPSDSILRRLAMPVAAFAFAAIVVEWFLLTSGH